MCASGAIEYAHSMSSVASPDQPAAAHGPDFPWELVHVFLYCGFPLREDLLEAGVRQGREERVVEVLQIRCRRRTSV